MLGICVEITEVLRVLGNVGAYTRTPGYKSPAEYRTQQLTLVA